MIKKFLIILSVLMVVACVSSAPISNAEFDTIKSLSDLQGLYRNKGDTGESIPAIYLSRVIWPDDKELNHESIYAVEVLKSGSTQLFVKALSSQAVEKEDRFLLGKDFSLEDGRITIKREGGVAGFKSGEPMLGLYYGSVTLGLDKKGHGKYRSSGSAIGMVFLIVPMAISGQNDVRFERIR